LPEHVPLGSPFFYIYAMHNRHILQCVMQCVHVLYIIICNTVHLIVDKVTSRDVNSTALCGF